MRAVLLLRLTGCCCWCFCCCCCCCWMSGDEGVSKTGRLGAAANLICKQWAMSEGGVRRWRQNSAPMPTGKINLFCLTWPQCRISFSVLCRAQLRWQYCLQSAVSVLAHPICTNISWFMYVCSIHPLCTTQPLPPFCSSACIFPLGWDYASVWCI